MDFTLTSAADSALNALDPAAENGGSEAGFTISPSPLVSADRKRDADMHELPRSYGGETLCLLARDPQSLFAYWDIDWANTFAEATPLERKVYLRILSADGAEEKRIEVEPMAGGHIVETAARNIDYTAELGYYSSAGEWKSVAISTAVNTPPALPTDGVTADMTTIPFHLSFQRMLDVLRVPNQEGEPLTAMLSTLRERADSDRAGDFSVGQRELIDTIDQVIAHAPPPAEVATTTALWTRERLERMPGFKSSSTHNGLGGSSASGQRL